MQMPDDYEPDLELWRRWLADRMTEAGLDPAGVAARKPGWLTAEMVEACFTSGERTPGQTVIDIADALGASQSEAAAAAGWPKLAETMVAVAAGTPEAVGAERIKLSVEEFLDLPLPDDVKQGLLGRWGYGLPDFMPGPEPTDDGNGGEVERRDDA